MNDEPTASDAVMSQQELADLRRNGDPRLTDVDRETIRELISTDDLADHLNQYSADDPDLR